MNHEDDQQMMMEILKKAQEEDAHFCKEMGYLPLGPQFERFLDKGFFPHREFEVDSFEPVAFIYDENEDIDGDLDLVDLLDERINRYFGVDSVTDLGRALRRIVNRESKFEGYFKVRSFGFKKFFIIRDNKVLEMPGYITIRMRAGTAAEARLSHVDDSYLWKVKAKSEEHKESCLILYRDIPT